jgi:hypothetical protein
MAHHPCQTLQPFLQIFCCGNNPSLIKWQQSIVTKKFWRCYKLPRNHQSLLQMDQSNHTEHKEPSPGCWQIETVPRGLGVADQ